MSKQQRKRVRDEEDSTSSSISRFHTLFKRLARAATEEEKQQLNGELEAMGGLAAYQAISVSGEVASNFDSSVWVLQELDARGRGATPLTLLDVGAIHSRYQDKANLTVTSIDLLSQDAGVQEVDFFDFARGRRNGSFDVIVLSLVLNFVGSAEERGRMLAECARILKQGGLLFLVLPEAALSNSRYFKFGLLRRLLRRVGLPIADKEAAHKNSEKLFFAVCERDVAVEKEVNNTGAGKDVYKRTVCRGGTARNNFCILLSAAQPRPDKPMPEQPRKKAAKEKKIFFTKGDPTAPKKASTSNQRKKARMRKLRESKQREKAEAEAPPADFEIAEAE